MKVLEINSVCGIRSTGRIATDLAMLLKNRGDSATVAYGRESVPPAYEEISHRITTPNDVRLHALSARIFDNAGFCNTKKTREFVKWIEEYDPDIIHLHNLHGYYLNIEVLFDYLRQSGKPVLYSLYDCWSFTGHCAHYDFYGCQKWKSGCEDCPLKADYPKTLLSRAKSNYERKKQLFSGFDNLHIIAPSQWMASQVKESYLKNYPVHILPNGITVEQFCRKTSSFREDHGIGDKFMVLGVSSFWTAEKGVEALNRLANDLPRDSFQVVTVGKQKPDLPLSDKILTIDSTDSIEELCRIYSAADLFVNPTLQETQGLTTVEAFACGTPAVVYRSGGAAECVDASCGISVERGDYEGLKNAILSVAGGKMTFTKEQCRAKAEAYDKNKLYLPFLDLYDQLYRQAAKTGDVLNV